MSNLLLSMLGAPVAELELVLILERPREGTALAKGKKQVPGQETYPDERRYRTSAQRPQPVTTPRRPWQ
jgi:hypothetical protein